MEETAVLEPQADADASSDDRFADDKSVDTGVIEPAPEPTEVETEVEEVAEEPESEAESSTAEVEVLDEKADPMPDGVQERIDKVTKSWRETERALTALEQENEDLRKQISEIPSESEPFKTLEDFEFDSDKYQKYLASEIDSRSKAAAERAVSGFQAKTDTDNAASEFESRELEFAKTVKDYDEVAHSRGLKISNPMAAVLRGQENGPEMAYYLGNNPDVARRISSLPAEAVGFELGLIQASMAAEKAKAAAPKKVTDAPPPPPKIPAGDEGLQRRFYEGMPDKEFNKLRRKQIANR